MLAFFDRNFPTVAMLVALAMILVTAQVLILCGKAAGGDVVITELISAGTGLAGGIAGFSMHKLADKNGTGTTSL